MKVVHAPKEEFHPITITLETEEEANKMWLVLNSTGKYVNERAEKHNVLIVDCGMYDMWNSFNEVYYPYTQ